MVMSEKANTLVIALIITVTIITLISCSNSQIETIHISGSPEATPLIQTLSDEYHILTEGLIQTSIRSSNSDAAFIDLCSGKTHIATSTRPISNTEITQCSDSSIKVVELPLASVSTVLVTHSMNKQSPKCLSNEDLRNLWNGTSDLSLTLYRPESNSDFSKFLNSQLINNETSNSQKSLVTSASLVTDLINDIHGIGFLDYVTYSLVEEHLNPVGLQSYTDTCSMPNRSKVSEETYDVLNRTLFLYFRHDLLKKDYLSGFAEMTMSESSINIISNLGYTTLDSTVYAQNHILLDERTAGSRYIEKTKNTGGIK